MKSNAAQIEMSQFPKRPKNPNQHGSKMHYIRYRNYTFYHLSLDFTNKVFILAQLKELRNNKSKKEEEKHKKIFCLRLLIILL